jgi:CRISPR-associated protein (TIGR03984 family)
MNNIIQIRSKVDLIPLVQTENELVSTIPSKGKFNVVSYLDNALLIGTYTDGKFCFFNNDLFNYNSIQRIRIFDLTKEWLYWRTSVSHNETNIENLLTGRIRTDGDGDDMYVKEIAQLLIGSKTDTYDNGFERLYEDRGFEIIKPQTLSINKCPNERQAIITRNYLEQWDNGQLSYVDCRMVEFGYSNGGEK